MIDLPLIGIGTLRLYDEECRRVVASALRMGYRHIDTALAYENHQVIGQAIKDFDREQLFITSKLSLGTGRGPFGVPHIDRQNIYESTLACCERVLEELRIDYLDLMLIHWPSSHWPLDEICLALQSAVAQGKLRFFGVSNFTEHHLQGLYEANIPIAYNQIEYHPYLNQESFLTYCRNHGTEVIAYRPFGKGQLLQEEPLFAEIGERYGKSAPQVILRWLFQKNIATIPKATSEAHLKENLAIFDFTLSQEQMRQIDRLNQNKRYCMSVGHEFFD